MSCNETQGNFNAGHIFTNGDYSYFVIGSGMYPGIFGNLGYNWIPSENRGRWVVNIYWFPSSSTNDGILSGYVPASSSAGSPPNYGGTCSATLPCEDAAHNTFNLAVNINPSGGFLVEPGILTALSGGDTIGISVAPSSGGGSGGGGGDPHFLGLDNKTFDYHGKHNHYYSLIFDNTVRLNALFTKFNEHTTYMTKMGFAFENKSRVTFLNDGTMKTKGSVPIVSRVTNPEEASKVDLISKYLEPDSPKILEVTELEIKHWWFMVTRMDLGGFKFMNVGCKLDSCFGCRKRPTGIIGQTILPVEFRKPNSCFEVSGLFGVPVTIL
jgi:hypothetical protein